MMKHFAATVTHVNMSFCFFITVVDPCASFPCRNGGNCTSNKGNYSCVCAYGFTGENCEEGMLLPLKTATL